MIRKYLYVIFILLALIFCGCKQSPTVNEIIITTLPSVVQIKIGDFHWGSGVIVGKDLILTAQHVTNLIYDINEVSIIYNDGEIETEVIDVYSDKNDGIDAALIKVNTGNRIPIKFDKDKIFLGEDIIVIGTPIDEELYNTVSFGKIAGLNREIEFFGNIYLIQADVGIAPGNSGGPVIDMDGEILGIAIGGYLGYSHITIIVPIEMCEKVIEGYNNATK